jgi:acyl dehydratase
MAFDHTCTGRAAAPVSSRYDWRDAALYAMGLGAGTSDLEWVLDDPQPKVVPTFGVVPAFGPVFELLKSTGGNLVTLLHSGQRAELLRPFPPRGEMTTTAAIQGIWDMKIGAMVFIGTETAVDGVPTARTEWQLLLRGEGGFGGARPPALLRTKPPAGAAPLFRAEIPTRRDQALLYRLNGDINPIHSRPDVAKAAGFDRPILHGLCTYGVAARAALAALAGDDPARFSSFEARFAKVVMPGDTLVVEGYALDAPGRAAITVAVKETSEVAIANALFSYR